MSIRPGFVAEIGHQCRDDRRDDFGGERFASEWGKITGEAQEIEDGDVDDVGDATHSEEFGCLAHQSFDAGLQLVAHERHSSPRPAPKIRL